MKKDYGIDVKLSRKWKVHVVHNAHTDLGYTHRQEYLYRAHARYIEKVIEICKKNEKYKWTVESYWMVENFKTWSSEEMWKDFLHFIEKGNIEITTNYLGMFNIVDEDVVTVKALDAKKLTKNAKTALQQDVNAISRAQAQALVAGGTENIYVSVHTHHGMFVGDGKQRGFIWDLENGSKVKVWNGEHYMMGNELFLHKGGGYKYIFKDDIETFTSDKAQVGKIRLRNYLKLLEEENYPYDSILVPVSGVVIDNSPPNEAVVNGVAELNEIIGDEIDVKLSSMNDFFDSIPEKDMPTLKGEWTSWWIDGAFSTPEDIRVYREAKKIYRIVKAWASANPGKIKEEQIQDLENKILLFSEHTWGSWSSQGDPFSNGNNLLFLRKKGMANDVSEIAWTLLDEVKEQEGYKIVKIKQKDSYTLINPYDFEFEQTISVQMPKDLKSKMEKERYIQKEEIFKVMDEKGNILPSAMSRNMGGLENINTSIESSETLMFRVKMQPLEKISVKVVIDEQDYNPFTSSSRPVGVENEDDVYYAQDPKIVKYNRDGIENEFYDIKWDQTGVYSIFDKELKEELLKEGRSITPIHVLSAGDSRRRMGRNRQGPSNVRDNAKMISHKRIIDKQNIQMIQLIFKVGGTKQFLLNLSITNIDKTIRFETIIQKTNELESENMYMDFPFVVKKDVLVHTNAGFFKAWKEQLPLSNIDYIKAENGIVIDNDDHEIALSTIDLPLMQFGTLDFKRRELMNDKLDITNAETMVWMMTNYWETNFKGSLEGNYKFKFEVTSGKNTRKWMEDSSKSLIAFPDYEDSGV